MSNRKPIFDAIERTLTQKRTIFHYLVTTLIFGLLIVFAYIPTPHLTDNDPHGYNNIIYLWMLFFSGLVTICLCKGILLLFCRHNQPKLPLLISLILLEFILTCAVISFFAWQLHTSPTLTPSLIISVTAKYLFLITLIPYALTLLWNLHEERKTEVEKLRDILSLRENPTPETSDITINFCDKSGKLSFATKRSNVLYVEAADNYTNIHYLSGEKEEQFILHNSLKNVEQSFSSYFLMRCHRGYLVNVDNIKLLRREKDGMVLEIAHCDRLIPVSKTYSESIVKHFTM